MSILSVYARGAGLVRGLPWLLAFPFAAELLQHAVEIRLGMFARPLDAHAQAIRLGFGASKVAALFLTLLVALRWWRFEGDLARTLRPSRRLAKGLALVALVQTGGDLLALEVGTALVRTMGDPSRGARAAVMILPLLGWSFLSGSVYPWYVSLLTEGGVTLRRSILVMRGRLFRAFGRLIVGFLPLMIVHYALGLGAMGRAGPLLSAMLLIDAGVVALLATMLAATLFEIFDEANRALGRP